jgi:hypothetical protein
MNYRIKSYDSQFKLLFNVIHSILAKSLLLLVQ